MNPHYPLFQLLPFLCLPVCLPVSLSCSPLFLFCNCPHSTNFYILFSLSLSLSFSLYLYLSICLSLVFILFCLCFSPLTTLPLQYHKIFSPSVLVFPLSQFVCLSSYFSPSPSFISYFFTSSPSLFLPYSHSFHLKLLHSFISPFL